MKIAAKMLKWRRKQAPGKIMKPETFSKIKTSAEGKGLSAGSAQKVAGAAYWKAAQSKFKGAK